MADPTTPPAAPTPSPSSIPSAPPTPPSAVWSLILGILSFVCCGFISAIPAVICGHVGRSAIKKSGGALGGLGMATAGLVLGYISLALHLILLPLSIPIFIKARDRARHHVEHISRDTSEVVSSNGMSHVTIPEDWSELKDLNDAAEIQAGNRSKEQYVMVLSESKSDFDGMTLTKHHQLTRNAMLRKMTNPKATDAVELTINGRSAMQDEISGTQDGVSIVFLHTTVEGDKHFHQVLAWTSKSRWDEQKEKLREVTRTFRSDD